MKTKDMDSVYSFVIMLRREYRDRPEEREHLHYLIEHLHNRYRMPIFILLYKDNNASLMKLSLSSELIRPIVFEEYRSAGLYINNVMKQVRSPFCCVLWNDVDINIRLDDPLTSWLLERRPLCAQPQLFDEEGPVPSAQFPVYHPENGYEAIPELAAEDGWKTLFPTDYMGIYDVEQFRWLQGFDLEFEQGYWQLSDFGFSAWLREMSVIINQEQQIRYAKRPPLMNLTMTARKRRFDAKHFAFTREPDGSLLMKRRIQKRIPDYMLDDYLKIPSVLYCNAEQLIAQWKK